MPDEFLQETVGFYISFFPRVRNLWRKQELFHILHFSKTLGHQTLRGSQLCSIPKLLAATRLHGARARSQRQEILAALCEVSGALNLRRKLNLTGDPEELSQSVQRRREQRGPLRP